MESISQTPAGAGRGRTAIAFDFDGTLIRGGPLNNDKSIHIMVSAWIACREQGLAEFLHPGRLPLDAGRMLSAYIRYPGAPRFQQLAAIVNALVNRRCAAPDTFDGFGLPDVFRPAYERVRAAYNARYSAINNAAARRYWTPYPSAKRTLRALSRGHALFIASGVTEDILNRDLARHRFDRRLFQGIHGGNAQGGNDKGTILKAIRDAGYGRVVFVADSNKDWEYAQEAGAEFFRVREDADFPRLLAALARPLPRIRPWTFSAGELRFMRRKTEALLQRYVSGRPMTPAQITAWINTRK